ncbi:YALIA101S02e09120g1_1 [Yarrowia lipolytica]|nr:YALIA101S02e09120g1_1 [Yarrowia lipolytica]
MLQHHNRVSTEHLTKTCSRFLDALERQQLERVRSGQELLPERIESTNERASEGLPPLKVDKHHYDTVLYQKKALIKAGPDAGTYEGIGTGRIYDEDGQVLKEGIKAEVEQNADRYENLFRSQLFHGKVASRQAIRTILASEMGCDMLPNPLQPFIMKRNSPMLQSAINNRKTRKHVRKFLNRNASRVDGLRLVPRKEFKATRTSPRFAMTGLTPTAVILQTSFLRKNWKTASKAFALAIRNGSFHRGSLLGPGIKILVETKEPPHNLSACTNFLNFLMLEMSYLKFHNRQLNEFSLLGRDIRHLISRSDDFLRNLALVHLKFNGTPEDLLTRLDEDMLIPPFSEDSSLMYLRGIVLLRCVYYNIEKQGVLSATSKELLDRARVQFELAHKGGMIFCLEEYLSLLDDISSGHVHGEVKLETIKNEGQFSAFASEHDSNSEYETVPWWDQTLNDDDDPASENASAEAAEDAEVADDGSAGSDEVVPWWETLNSDGDGNDSDDDKIEVDEDSDDDEIQVDGDSEPQVKLEPDKESALGNSDSDFAVKPEPSPYDEYDFGARNVEDTPHPKTEPNDDYDFDFDSDMEEPVIKTEHADIEVEAPSQSPVPQVKKEGFSTLDDLLGSMPGEKSEGKKDKKKDKKDKKDKDKKDKKEKKKKKKKKSRKSVVDDDVDLDI